MNKHLYNTASKIEFNLKEHHKKLFADCVIQGAIGCILAGFSLYLLFVVMG